MIINQFKMKNIKNIIIGIFVVIGFTSIVTGFTDEAFKIISIEVKNKSANNYKVCIYCYGQLEGSFNLGNATSTSVNVPCQTSSLEVKYGTYSCNNSAYSSGYNSYTLN